MCAINGDVDSLIDNGTYNGINYYQNTGSSEIANFENYTPEFPSGDFNEN